MRKQKKLALILALSFVLLLLLYFFVVTPLVNKEEPPTPPPTVDEGEGLYHNIRLLYEKVDRVDIKEIVIHSEEEDFSFVRYDEKDKYSDFVIKEGEEIYLLPEYEQQKISEIVVAVGTTYVREKIIKGEITEEVYAEYGLSYDDNPAYFILKTKNGEEYKVYVGEKTVNDEGYYLRREGADAVYVSQTTNAGKAVENPPEYYVKPILSREFTNYGYYYTKDFTLWTKITDENERVHRDDTVQFSYCELKENGERGETLEGSADLREMQVAIKDACEGKRIGDGGFTFKRKYPDNYENKDLAGRTVEYYVEKLLGFDRLEICLNYLNMDERSLFSAGEVYEITDPRDKRAYTPNSAVYMEILENIGVLEGVEVVEFGLTAEKIAKYGLGAYKVYYESPETIKGIDGKNDVIASDFLANAFYISEKNEDGSYYVGSMLYDIIAKVDGEKMDFVSYPFSKWVTNKPFSASINDILSTEFKFNYADAKESHTFILSHSGEGEKLTLSKVFHKESSTSVAVNNYRQLYMNMLTVYYSGDYDGKIPTETLTADEKNCILTLTLTLKDGETRKIKFYPYTERKVLVSVDGGAYFYISAPEVEKFYRDISLILDGKKPDYEKIY